MSEKRPSHGQSVTLFDVAARAGVSHQTVSRVINGKKGASAETRGRVLRAIAELDYQPNVAAQNLASRRSNLVGLITHATNFAGPANIVTVVDQTALGFGYRILLASLSSLTQEMLLAAHRQLIAHGVSGILVNIPEVHGTELVTILPRAIPIVLMDAIGSAHISSVMVDHKEGSRLLTEHLVSLGHRHIAHIAGLSSWWSGRLRREGWLEVLDRNNLPLGPCIEEEWSAEGGYRAGTELFQDHRERFTAVVASNDVMALGLMSAAKAARIRVPDDISIVGFDNIPTSRFFDPPLTTVQFDFDHMARRSFIRLTQLMENQDQAVHHELLPTELICRRSTRSLLACS